MKHNKLQMAFLLLAAGMFLAGCTGAGEDSSSGSQSNTIPGPNRTPSANAGTNQSVVVGTQVTLSGAASTDPDGDPLTYRWTFSSAPTGSAASLINATNVQPRFTPDVAGVYVIQLIVNDGNASSPPATVSINATAAVNRPPVANAGPSQSRNVNDLVTLNGSASSDPDGNPITYSWTLTVRPANSTAALAGATTARPTFTADRAGSYTAQLVVNDGALNSAPSNVTITANTPNAAPVANAGPDQSVSVGVTVTLNGTGSTDSNGDSLTYAWTMLTSPTGSNATLSSATAAQPTFRPNVAGTYVAQLIVNDGRVNSAADTVNITATAAVVTCDSLKAEFQTVTWTQVLRTSCLTCHQNVSNFRLVPESTSGFNDTNFANFKNQAILTGGGSISLILTKAAHLDSDHGGNVVTPQGSPAYNTLSDMVNKTKTCTGNSGPTTGVVNGSGYNRLRKATLALGARLPTAGEETAVNNAGTNETAVTNAINSALDTVMTEAAFYTRVKEIYNDLLLTDYYVFNNRAVSDLDLGNFANRAYFDTANLTGAGYSSADANTLRSRANYGLAKAPVELAAYIVRNNRPFSEIVTADYVMVNAYSATIFNATVPGNAGFNFRYGDTLAQDPNVFVPVRLTDSSNRVYEHAGVLSTLPFLDRYPSTSTNRNRARARYAFLYFLDTDVEGLANRAGLDLDNVVGQFPTMQDPQCTVCHNVVDPVAGLFKNWNNNGVFSGNVTNWYSTRNPKEMVDPGYTLNAADRMTSAQSPTALQFLGARIAADNRFAVATVKTVLRGLLGDAALGDTALVEQLKQTFLSSNFNMKTLIKAVVASSHFKAVNLGTNENPNTYATLGSPVLSTPEQLERKITAVTGGYLFRSPGNRTLTDVGSYLLLYGGIDSMNVTERTREPTSVMAAVQERLAYQAACGAVSTDFAKTAGTRALFPNVAITDQPDNGTGTNRIKQNIQYLHKRILGEELAVNDPEITRTYDLFVAVKARSTGTNIPTDCANGLATSDPIRVDSNGTVRSWMAVVAYLMMDYKFLFE